MSKVIVQNSSAYEYILSTAEPMKVICEPLSHLGISYFGYMKIFESGAYLLLDNHLDFRKIFFNTIKIQDAYLTKTTELSYKLNNNHSYFLFPTSLSYFDKKNDPTIHLAYNLNIWNIFCIHKKNITYYEFYIFCMNRDAILTSEFYLNNLPLLEHFIDYFHEKAIDLIETNNIQKLTYFDQKFNFTNFFKQGVLNQNTQNFLEKTQLQYRLIRGKDKKVRLSQRQVECLQYLCEGYTIKEIGKILFLSPRTVEFYLRNIKQKTGYLSRKEYINSLFRK